MPLSENEERILAQIEAGLRDEDPRFVERASKLGSDASRSRRLRLAIVGFVLGVGCLLAITFSFAFGVIGFSLMLISVLVGARSLPDVRKGGDDDILARIRRGLGREDEA